ARPLEELTTLTAAMGGGQSSNPDGLWAINVPYFPVGEGNVSVTVTDERSKINLNALVSGSSIELFLDAGFRLVYLEEGSVKHGEHYRPDKHGEEHLDERESLIRGPIWPSQR
ncbi:MAG: general secretion pathway protein GspK, partial [Candidatus Dadabacteria bacterium]